MISKSRQPLDVVHIQMPSGLVQHEHVGVHELGSAELHLHLPATAIGCHRQLQVGGTVGASGVAEADGLHQVLGSEGLRSSQVELYTTGFGLK